MSWLTWRDFFFGKDATLWVGITYDFALKSSLFLLAVFLLYQAARRLPSSFRHFLLSLAFGCLSLLPACLIFGPQWRFPFLSAPGFLTTSSQLASGLLPIILICFWIGGFVFVVIRVGVGLWVTHFLRQESLPLDDPEWSAEVQACSYRLELREDVPLLINHRVGAAICAGIFRPCVILPAAALDWSEEQRQTILRHELGHVKRRDNLTNIFALGVCAVYWFNPLVWWAGTRLRLCREAACDDLVLNCGIKPSRYVSFLLEATSSPPSPLISVTLSHITVFKKRVLTILDPHVNRRTIGPVSIIASLFVAALVLTSLSALQPWIIPSFRVGLAEKLQVLEQAGVRFASRFFLEGDTPEGRGRLQANRESRLLGLPAAFIPSRAPQILSELGATRVNTIDPAGTMRVSGAAGRGRRFGAFAPSSHGFYGMSDYPTATAAPFARIINSGPKSPSEPPPAQPDQPPAQTPADLTLTRLSLGTLGGPVSVANDINEAGSVVGASTDGLGKSQPFLWSKVEGMSSLPCPSGDCRAIDINNSGQVLVVAYDQAGSRCTSYVWSGDTLIDIGSLGGKSTHALEINDHGQIVGTSDTSIDIPSAFFWSPETGMLDLGGSKAVALNGQGQVIGWAGSYAFFWDAATDTFRRIGDLNTKAEPFDMNNRGDVVGYAHIGKSSQPKAFYWSPTDGMTEIEFPDRPTFSCAFRINDDGEVLAITRDSANRERTFSWRRGQQAQEQSLPNLLVPQLNWQLMSSSSSSVALIGSNLPSSKLAEELAKVDFGTYEEPSALAQPVKMNGRGQIAGNLVRPALSQVEAVVWEIRLPKVEESIREVLKELPTFNLRADLQAALDALTENDYQAAASNLSSFLQLLSASDSSIPESKRKTWNKSMQGNLDRISHFTVLK